jgi:hypothetical protein
MAGEGRAGVERVVAAGSGLVGPVEDGRQRRRASTSSARACERGEREREARGWEKIGS